MPKTTMGRKPIAKSKLKSHRVTISLTAGQFRALKAQAKREGMKISAAASLLVTGNI